MLTRKKQRINSPLGPGDLFSNMKGGTAFRVIETYKNIRTSLVFTLAGGKDNAVLVTSAEPNSGKSVTSANLALSFAQTGSKVLLIDCDMRNPSQPKIFTQENIKGLSNVLGGMCTFEEVLKRGVKENLDLLSAGQTPPNPSELLGSDNMKKLLDKVREGYDFVFLDCPPIGLVSDTSSLLLIVPQTLVIARQNYAIYEDVIHAVESIKAVGGKILGAVLTDVRESEKSYSYASGAYSHYGRYGRYGYSKYGKYGRRYGNYYGYGYGYGHSYGRSTSSNSEAEKKASDNKAK